MIKRLAVMVFAVVAMSMSAQARCFIGSSNPCGPNNPQTVRGYSQTYYVAQRIPCPGPTGFYIIASNGQQWHDARGLWPHSVHVGQQFRVVNGYFDSQGVHHGDVQWID